MGFPVRPWGKESLRVSGPNDTLSVDDLGGWLLWRCCGGSAVVSWLERRFCGSAWQLYGFLWDARKGLRGIKQETNLQMQTSGSHGICEGAVFLGTG